MFFPPHTHTRARIVTMFPIPLFATARSTRPFFTSPAPDLEKSWCGTAPVTERAGSEGARKGDTWHVGSLLGREGNDGKWGGMVVENVSAVGRKFFSVFEEQTSEQGEGWSGRDRVGKKRRRRRRRRVAGLSREKKERRKGRKSDGKENLWKYARKNKDN